MDITCSTPSRYKDLRLSSLPQSFISKCNGSLFPPKDCKIEASLPVNHEFEYSDIYSDDDDEDADYGHDEDSTIWLSTSESNEALNIKSARSNKISQVATDQILIISLIALAFLVGFLIGVAMCFMRKFRCKLVRKDKSESKTDNLTPVYTPALDTNNVRSYNREANDFSPEMKKVNNQTRINIVEARKQLDTNSCSDSFLPSAIEEYRDPKREDVTKPMLTYTEQNIPNITLTRDPTVFRH